MAFAVVEPLQSDSVDVHDDESAACPTAAVEFAVKVGQARRSGASPRQRVHLGDCKRPSERLAICARLQAVTGALLAVYRRRFAIPSCLRPMLRGLRAVVRGALALFGGTDDQVRTGDCARVVLLVISITPRHREIARGGSPISRQGRQIARVRGLVALVRALKARHGGLLTLERRTPTDLTAGLMLSWIDAVREVAIAGGLITIGRGLVAVRAPLVLLTTRLLAVGQRLLGVGQRLLGVGQRLRVTGRLESADAAVMQLLDRSVGGLLRTII